MELFPALDESAWELIRGVIEASDYYLLVIGGRYGSLDEDGLSYTEKEYDYAVSLGKPVIPLLHEDPGSIERDKTETDPAIWKKLEAFRQKVERKHHRTTWKTAEELSGCAVMGLLAAIKRYPAVGWIRADQAPSGATVSNVLQLQNRVVELQNELEKYRSGPPSGSEDLKQGDDQFKVQLKFRVKDPSAFAYKNYQGSFDPTWNDIFSSIAPSMITEISDVTLRVTLEKRLWELAKKAFEYLEELKGQQLTNYEFFAHDIDTCIIQLRALGLIKESDKKRSVKDTGAYWTLTNYGDRLMMQLRALRHAPSENKPTGSAKMTPSEGSDGKAA
jgi:hypothetical protein